MEGKAPHEELSLTVWTVLVLSAKSSVITAWEVFSSFCRKMKKNLNYFIPILFVGRSPCVSNSLSADIKLAINMKVLDLEKEAEVE